MAFIALPFTRLGWSPGGHPLERKKRVGDHPAVLLEFAPGFEDPHWCARGHMILVLEGSLDLVLTERTERIHAGDGCVLDPQTPHRAKNTGTRTVRLFVLSTDGD